MVNVTVIRVYKVKREDIPPGMSFTQYFDNSERVNSYYQYVIDDEDEENADYFLKSLSCIGTDEY